MLVREKLEQNQFQKSFELFENHTVYNAIQFQDAHLTFKKDISTYQSFINVGWKKFRVMISFSAASVKKPFSKVWNQRQIVSANIAFAWKKDFI